MLDALHSRVETLLSTRCLLRQDETLRKPISEGLGLVDLRQPRIDDSLVVVVLGMFG